jgi:hypothetical protein
MIKLKINKLFLLLLFVFSILGVFGNSNNVSAVQNSSYNPDIANKLVNRCDFIADYLSQTARINELAARQNKVRGWEFILRRLGEVQQGYSKFNIDYADLAGDINKLRSQLEQFKVDFEVYDDEFQGLIAIDCGTNPERFWQKLESVKTFRSGIALASENFTNSLDELLKKEESKW